MVYGWRGITALVTIGKAGGGGGKGERTAMNRQFFLMI